METVVTQVPGSSEYRVHAVGYLLPPGAVDPKRPWVIPELIEDTPLYRMSIEMPSPTVRCKGTHPLRCSSAKATESRPRLTTFMR